MLLLRGPGIYKLPRFRLHPRPLFFLHDRVNIMMVFQPRLKILVVFHTAEVFDSGEAPANVIQVGANIGTGDTRSQVPELYHCP